MSKSPSPERSIALVDCNSAYASMEILFQPWLRDQAVVVLSSNDGNAIARNAPAKALGVKMGQPWHEIASLYRQGKLHVFSSNFALYQEVSNRVMATLEQLAPRISIYSIDEAWVDCSGLREDLNGWGANVRSKVFESVGMPVGVGIGSTKTMAKLSSWAAKTWAQQTNGVVDIRNRVRLEKLLKIAPVAEVWGIGPRLTQRLERDMGITTAWGLATANRRLLRRHYGVTVERTSRELLGEACYGFEEGPEPKQMIASTQSFGRKIYDRQALASALATYTARAAAKLRAQGSLAQCMQVFASTSAFSRGEPYKGHEIVSLPYPTADTRDLVKSAQTALWQFYRDGPAYARAGVVLSQFVPSAHYIGDLFQGGPNPKSEATMKVVDALNQRMGRGTVRLGREDVDQGWRMKRQFLSPSYTTRWTDLPIAR